MTINTTTLGRYTSILPPSLLIAALPCFLVLGVLATIRLYTTSQYRRSLSTQFSSARGGKSTKAAPPPPIPYTIPFLGHAVSFLARRPGEFWSQLFRSHPRATGACTLLLGGRSIHILFSPSAVQALFKARSLGRDGFNSQITEWGLGIEHDECVKYWGHGEGPDHTIGMTPVEQQERMNHKYLLEKTRVNELTATFTRVLRDQLAGELESEGGKDGDATSEKTEGLYAWLRDRMFNASTTAFMGSRILEVYPTLCKDFFDFDTHMLTLFFGLPKFLRPTAYKVRGKTLDGLTKYHQQMQEDCQGDPPADPDGEVDWEPIYGSRANRARQRYYAARGLNPKARAGMDLGFQFGLNSNAIPATGWMLMHILDPQGDASIYGKVMGELEGAERGDGSLDIPTLVTSPLLQSILHEILRLYVDVLVTRELMGHELSLPLDDNDDGHHHRRRQVLLNKNTVVMAPSWLGHRDETHWTGPACNQFYAERFLTTDPETGKQIFTTSGTDGKFFPFGGGKTICPGRVFAKQEVLASVAMVLLKFDLEPLGFEDAQGNSTNDFPGLRDSYPGSGIMAMDGDMRVRIKHRRKGSKA